MNKPMQDIDRENFVISLFTESSISSCADSNIFNEKKMVEKCIFGIHGCYKYSATHQISRLISGQVTNRELYKQKTSLLMLFLD